jgi:hypothetical protein
VREGDVLDRCGRAVRAMQEADRKPEPVADGAEPVNVLVDGGMLRIDKRWQEVKVGCVYRGEDGRWHRYTPDFVIRKRPRKGGKPGTGRVLIVEIKSQQFEAATREDEKRFARGDEPITVEGRKAVALRKFERLNPERLRYELIFVRTGLAYDQLDDVRSFVREPETLYGAELDTAKQLCGPILSIHGPRVEKVILFGSRARGDARSDSDFDLLVVVDEIEPAAKEAYLLALYRSLRDTVVVAEPWVVSRAEFEETKMLAGSLAYPAWAEGVVLYERS